MNKTAQRVKGVLFAMIFLAGAALVFWKCRFGFANIDETFYLTIPYRLTQGDGLFVHEWHLSQMGGFLLYPFMLLYRWIHPDTAGIVLWFRYLYAVLHTGGALLIWYRLRRQGGWGLGAALLYLLFAPYGIMALSYNSMGVACVTLSAVLLATNSTNRRTVWFIAGLLWAAAVLCCPYLAGGYLLFAVGCLVVWILAARFPQKLPDGRTSLPMLAWVTAGCAALAVVFLAFVFSRATLSELLTALPQILDDPEHPSVGFAEAVLRYLYWIWHSNARAPLALGIGAVLAAVILLDRRPGWRRYLYGATALLLTAWFGLPFLRGTPMLNYLMFPVAYLGLFAFLLAPAQNGKLFLFPWLGGVLYSFCVSWSSNQGFFVISMAMTASAVAGCAMVGNWLAGWCSLPACRPARLLRLIACGMLAVFLLVEGRTRYETLFWEYAGMDGMTSQIQNGPEKGLWVSATAWGDYEGMYADVESLWQQGQGPVLCYTNHTFPYLCSELPMGSFSAWLGGTGPVSFAKLQAYYQLNPDKFPAAAYCFKSDAFAVEALRGMLEPLGYTYTETEKGFLFTAH